MHWPISIIILAQLILSTFAYPSQQPLEHAHRETLQEAALNAKRLVHDTLTGTLASVFPDTAGDDAGHPFALLEYHAPCHPPSSLTFLLFPISLSTRNILSSPNHSAAYTVSMPTDGIRSPMSRGRVAFVGNMTLLDPTGNEKMALEKCYNKYHPDAWWLPGRGGPHQVIWARFDPQDIYYVGGFGDTHYIGHIPVDLYAKSDV